MALYCDIGKPLHFSGPRSEKVAMTTFLAIVETSFMYCDTSFGSVRK